MEFLTNHIKIIADAKIKINRKEEKNWRNKKETLNSLKVSENEKRETKKCSGLRTIAQFLDSYFKISEDYSRRSIQSG